MAASLVSQMSHKARCAKCQLNVWRILSFGESASSCLLLIAVLCFLVMLRGKSKWEGLVIMTFYSWSQASVCPEYALDKAKTVSRLGQFVSACL